MEYLIITNSIIVCLAFTCLPSDAVVIPEVVSGLGLLLLHLLLLFLLLLFVVFFLIQPYCSVGSYSLNIGGRRMLRLCVQTWGHSGHLCLATGVSSNSDSVRDIARLRINLSLKTVQLSPPIFGQFCEKLIFCFSPKYLGLPDHTKYFV